MDQSTELLTRLKVIRRTVRRRLVVYGACVVFAGGAFAFLTVIALDWLLWFPPLLRLIGAALFIVGFILAVLHWIVKPLQMPFGLEELAGRLEQHFAPLEDRLTSTVNFLLRGRNASEAMARRVVDNTERIVRDLPLESALSVRPVMGKAVWLLGSVVLLAIVLVSGPNWVRTGWYRYVYPMGEIEWPRSVSIIPLTGDINVAIGESVTVRMSVKRGLHDALRGVVHVREPDGNIVTLALTREKNAVFSTTIDAVTTDLDYWFTAGDDSTKRRHYTLRVVRRPVVVEVLANVAPPHYAAGRAVRVHDMQDGPISATIGGSVKVAIRASKPIPSESAHGQIGLRTIDGGLVPLIPDPNDPQRLSAEFDVSSDLAFQIELRDAEGFENRGAVRYEIRATPDAPPSISILEPYGTTELTPTGSVRLVSRVVDDFGVTSLALRAERLRGGSAFSTSLTDYMQMVDNSEQAESRVVYDWRIEPLSLSPGDVLIYTLSATDNFITPDGTGQLGRSESMRLKIISDVEFDARVRIDVALVEERLRQVVLDQAEIHDRTVALIEIDSSDTLSETDRERVMGLASSQERLVRTTRDLAERVRQLVDRLLRNSAQDEDARIRLAGLEQSLTRAANESMTQAGQALSSVPETADGHAQQVHLGSAATAERASLDELRTILRSLSQWGRFQGVVSRVRDLLNRQDELRRQTLEMGKPMLGKPVESLTTDEVAQLKRIQRRQRRLGADVDQVLERIKQRLDSTRDKDSVAAETFERALRAAVANDLTRHLDGATSALEKNRTAAAAIDQKSASAAIRKALGELQQRELRELQELRKRLQRAEDLVATLIEDQTDLRAATLEAALNIPEDAAIDALEREQRRLQQNAGAIADEWASDDRAQAAARLIDQSTVPMGQSAAQLRVRQVQPSAERQDEAIALLSEALQHLEELAQEVDADTLQRSLDQIHEALETLRDGQAEINQRVASLRRDVEERGRRGRMLSRESSRLAREQGNLRASVDTMLPELEQVIVYRWALDRVADWMEVSRSALQQRAIDIQLVETTDRIVTQLDRLIGAIEETQALPLDTEFIESTSGGGQAGSHKGPPIPTVAELLVLRAMQVDINGRTRSIYKPDSDHQATEQELRRIRTIGEDQVEVRRLTEMLTKRARR